MTGRGLGAESQLTKAVTRTVEAMIQPVSPSLLRTASAIKQLSPMTLQELPSLLPLGKALACSLIPMGTWLAGIYPDGSHWDMTHDPTTGS